MNLIQSFGELLSEIAAMLQIDILVRCFEVIGTT